MQVVPVIMVEHVLMLVLDIRVNVLHGIQETDVRYEVFFIFLFL